MLRVAIAGCHGRMGKALVAAALATSDVRLTGATVSPQHSLLDSDVGTIAGITPLHFKPVDDLNKIIDKFDVLIDMTTPEATMRHARVCHQYQKKIVIGTTGLSNVYQHTLQELSRDMAMVFAPNMSIGINLCYRLLKQAALVLGDSVDIEIVEAHHRNKVDAPSGAALKMGEILSTTLNRSLEDVAQYGRHGVNPIRDRKTIGFSSIRAGDIVGDHTVIFATEGERLEITHRAANRSTFAHGALRAAKWLHTKATGLFSMEDVLFGNSGV